ncbi:MAG: NAD-dependent epimerase/dehydratase family protein [Anaeroplasmataceae bacterium]|nr:NAD-dependent epimerase/dehydratase family protein [Anaeroplasmataceae bacterium]
MRTILIIGSTGVIGQKLVEQYKEENCIEISRSLKTEQNQFYLDLSNFQSILDFLNAFQSISVDLVFVNSGLVCEERITRDGLDTMWMVNAFGPYYLVKHFLKDHPKCKIILTSSVSILHAKLDFNPKNYNRMYRNTKLLEHILFRSLEEIYPESIIAYAHPGVVPSKLSLSLHQKPIQFWMQRFGNSKENAVEILSSAEHMHSKDCWVCPKGIFQLRGKAVLKKIKRNLELDLKTKETIEKTEKELERKYGISCDGL